MEKRKVGTVGNRSLAIVIPAWMARELKIKKKQWLKIEIKDKKLIITK